MWKLWAFEYLQMDCNGSGHTADLVMSHSLIISIKEVARGTDPNP